MNGLARIICFVSLFLIMAAPAAFATPYVVAGDSIQLSSANFTGYNGYGAGMIKYNISGNGIQPFQIGTFCIQDNVDIGWNKYTVGNVSDIVGWSKSDPTGNPSIKGEGPLAPAVNWLYEQYSIGTFNTLTASQQADFQNLLWYLQGEDNGTYSAINTTFSTTSAWYTDYANNFKNASAGNPSGKWGTEVLNIVDSNGNVQQNQLVYQSVPEPSTFTLLIFGMGLLGVLLGRSKTAKNPV
ncbi:MAG: PEP-CTERM sorting domain-containing protein [Nitrospiraceae bacterium]|nr:PEP-CTERM sorting domain-containing protein [Nitrospiraceae bacterium]